jgi:hypothetical protein
MKLNTNGAQYTMAENYRYPSPVGFVILKMIMNITYLAHPEIK